MSAYRKDRGIWSVWGTERSHACGKPRGQLFKLKYVKVRTYGSFFPGKTCYLMLVRGTISFYNQRLQILPVGGSALWNMSMWLNEQCWMWTISFFQLCLISCKSVLISWTYVLVWTFFSTFMMSFPLWVIKNLIVDELSYHIYFYSCSFVWL